jgi:hypothetical protein
MNRSIELQSEEMASNRVLWIPCFSIKEQKEFSEPKLMSDVIIKSKENEEEQFKIKYISEMVNLEMSSDKNNLYHISPFKNDIIIKESFLFAIINLDILADLSIPSIYLTIVEKENWVKI